MERVSAVRVPHCCGKQGEGLVCVGFGLGARGRRRKGLAERKCYNDTWLWEEYLGLTSSFSSLACYLSEEAVLMHVYIFEYSKGLRSFATLQFEYPLYCCDFFLGIFFLKKCLLGTGLGYLIVQEQRKAGWQFILTLPSLSFPQKLPLGTEAVFQPQHRTRNRDRRQH